MKKFLPIVLLLVLAVAAWYFSSQKQSGSVTTSTTNSNSASSTEANTSALTASNANTAPGTTGAAVPSFGSADIEDDEGEMDVEVLPASRAYKGADEALAAIKKGAIDYDDSILEQFTEPGDDCTWCPEFYKGVRELLSTKGLSADQVSYYGELLAVSGKLDNIQALVEGIKNPSSEEQGEAFAEALELTIGKENVVQYLAEQMSSTDDKLREASVAAVTNQGSRLAAETLYKHTIEHGDPDGYYSLGIGLGEFVPDEESLPYLQQLVSKRDPYSHLAVKALLNSGLGGMKMVFDSLSSSKDPESDKALLKDAVDHINYEEDVEAYLKEQADSSRQPALQDFAKKALETLKASDVELEEEEQLQSPLNP